MFHIYIRKHDDEENGAQNDHLLNVSSTCTVSMLAVFAHRLGQFTLTQNVKSMNKLSMRDSDLNGIPCKFQLDW